MRAQILKIFSLAALAMLVTLAVPGKDTVKEISSPLGGQISKPEADKNTLREILPLEAGAAYVYDIFLDKPVFELNAGASLPIASLAKLMTAVIAKEILPRNLMILITREALLKDGDNGFLAGEMWPLGELTDAMLISSSNDAAFAIASALRKDQMPDDSYFVSQMNKKAGELGLTNTRFSNSTGLDISKTEGGAYSSAKEMMNLMRYIMENHPDILPATTKERLTLNGKIFKNTNKLLPKLPFYIGGKTGYDDYISGGNLIVAVDKGLNHPVIIVVLGSTEDGRFKDVEMLYNKYIK